MDDKQEIWAFGFTFAEERKIKLSLPPEWKFSIGGKIVLLKASALTNPNGLDHVRDIDSNVVILWGNPTGLHQVPLPPFVIATVSNGRDLRKTLTCTGLRNTISQLYNLRQLPYTDEKFLLDHMMERDRIAERLQQLRKLDEHLAECKLCRAYYRVWELRRRQKENK